MWHPFDLIPDLLAIDPELRNAQPGLSRTLAFKERSLTYFKDKSSESEQWPVTMEEMPGVRITRRGAQDGRELSLHVNHTWRLDCIRTLAGEMKCFGPWHSPVSWSFHRDFKLAVRGAKPFGPVTVEGSWRGGELRQTARGSVHQQVQSESAKFALSTYALMSGFPMDAKPPQESAALLGEDLTISDAARVGRCSKVLREHALADGLAGYVVDAHGDFPTEFWVNRHGLAVYVFNGVGKVFILSEVTDAP